MPTKPENASTQMVNQCAFPRMRMALTFMMKLRGFWMVWGLVAVLGAGGCRRERLMGVSKSVPIRADGGIALQVMSFNIRYEGPGDVGTRSWRQRVVGAVKLIQREQPDLMGVQEALHGQAADLWASLPDFEFFGVGRTDGKKAGEYSGIFYLRGRFEPDPTDQGTFWLSAHPEQVGSHDWGNDIPRVAAWMRLKDRATGRWFYLFNTHWDHRNQNSRERSAILISRRIDQRQHPDEPVVLTGDFNSTESNPAVAYLAGKPTTLAGQPMSWPGLIDTYQVLNPREKNRQTLHFWSDSREGGLKVDHIFASRGVMVERADILSGDKPMVSDHFAVFSRLVFPLQR